MVALQFLAMPSLRSAITENGILASTKLLSIAQIIPTASYNLGVAPRIWGELGCSYGKNLNRAIEQIQDMSKARYFAAV